MIKIEKKQKQGIVVWYYLTCFINVIHTLEIMKFGELLEASVNNAGINKVFLCIQKKWLGPA